MVCAFSKVYLIHFLQNTLSIARPLSIQATNLADQAILKLVIFQMLPLSLVDAPEFDLLFAALGAKYHTPCRQTLTNRIINLYHVQQERMSQKLAREAISVAVTCDGWTSQQVVGYVAVTGHYLTEHFQPTRYCVSVVQTSSHTGDNIANAVLNKVKEGMLCMLSNFVLTSFCCSHTCHCSFCNHWQCFKHGCCC